MDMSIKVKNVIFRNFDDVTDLTKPRPEKGIDITTHRSNNNEGYASITGTKQQINHYLQDKILISDRLRTLNNIPKYRIINTTKERIY
jgi:hypothetical protein